MTSHVTAEFRRLFQNLPADVQDRARGAYRLWQDDPRHPGVRFRRVHPRKPIYSARIGLHWRALGARQENVVVWFWIGSHADYDGLLKRL